MHALSVSILLEEYQYEDPVDTNWNHKSVRFHQSEWEKQHSRLEQRRCWAIDVTAKCWDDYMKLPGRCQAIKLERQCEKLKTGEHSCEACYALTSLTTADTQQLLQLVRGHWEIETRVHYVRDFTYDEDRCRAHVKNMPQNLAYLSNIAISIIRCQAKFEYIPESNRHFAMHSQQALDLILKPIPA